MVNKTNVSLVSSSAWTHNPLNTSMQYPTHTINAHWYTLHALTRLVRRQGRNSTIARLSLKLAIKWGREEMLCSLVCDRGRRKAIVKMCVLERGVKQEGWLPYSIGTCQARVLSSVDSGDSHVTSWVSCLVPCHGEDYSDHCLQLHGKPLRTQVSQHTCTHKHTPFSFTDHKQNYTSPPNVETNQCVCPISISSTIEM